MKVLIADKMSPLADKILGSSFQVDVKPGLSEDEITAIIGEYDAVMVRSQTKITEKIIKAGKKLRIIGRAGVGVDTIDVPSATARGIIVVNSPEGNTIAAAEHSFALLLALARNIPKGDATMRAGKWERNKLVGVELYNKVLGVVGLGKIGRRVASYGNAFGMKVLGYDPFISTEYAKEINVELVTLDDLTTEADFISLHVPKTAETTNLFNADRLAKMKKGARIVNCARGGVINEDALDRAVNDGLLAGAAVDVFPQEPVENHLFAKNDKIIITPHLGASTEEAQINVAIDVAEEIVAVLKGGSAKNAVNIPSLKPEIMEIVKPYLSLAEKLGLLAGQLVSSAVTEVKVRYHGELAKKPVEPLNIAVLKGVLTPAVQENVNFVNAQLVAKDRGIQVTHTIDDGDCDFTNMIEIKLKDANKELLVSVAGTISQNFGNRLVNINGLKVDAELKGQIVVVPNQDIPGMVAKIATVLGDGQINIASMDVGREKAGGKAIMVFNVDSEASGSVLMAISKVEGVLGAAKLVKLQ